MEQDSSEVVPRGEIPSESEFARLLCDKTFVDYFNVFLSLPVFSQRLLFKFSDQSFELDPPLKRNQYRVDRIKLMRWVRTKRAPFFFKSDLYLEYLLCKQLQKSQLHLVFNYGPDPTSAKEKMMDHCLMTRWLKKASGMRRFRCFVSSTVGENSVQLWLDTERFRRAANQGEEKWALFYRRMETKYFKSRNVRLPQTAHMTPLQLYQSSLSSSTDTEMTDESVTLQKVTRDTCLAIQGFILKSLQNYWVPRYLIHCKQRFTKYCQTTAFQVYRPNCYAIRVRSLSEITSDDEGDGEGKGGKISSDVRSHHSIRKLQLLKQSVGNLMSMFSSNQVRRPKLLNVEDTGEMVRSGDAGDTGDGEEEESGDVTFKGHDWLTDEFPLPAISEESASYGRSRSASPTKGTPSISASIVLSSSTDGSMESDSGEKHESPFLSSEKASKMSKHSSRRSSACRSASPRRSSMTSDDMDSQRPGSHRRSSSGRRSRRGSARRGSSRRGSSRLRSAKEEESKHGSSDEQASSSSSSEESDKGQAKSPESKTPGTMDKAFTLTISSTGSETDVTDSSDVTNTGRTTQPGETPSVKDEHKPDKQEVKHRGTIADLNKYRRNSDTSRSSSRDSSSTSVGQASVSSGSMISLSKRRMSVPATGAAPRPPGMPKPPGARRPRSQSVEFRLGDFSLFIDKEEKDSSKKKGSKTGSDKDIKLEADLNALKALQKEREKRKRQRLRQLKALKRKKAKQKQESSSESEIPDLGTLQDGNDDLVSTLKRLAMRRRGTMAPLANINKTALKKLEQMHSISMSENDRHEKFTRKDRMANRQMRRIEYSLLPFEEKLLEDDRRLMLVSNLPEALEVIEEGVDIMGSLVPRRADTLPAIKIQPANALNITKPRFSSYNLGEANFRSKNRQLVSAVLSDKFAGWPWMKFLVRYSYSKEQWYLKFFHAAQDYLNAGHPIAGVRQDPRQKRLASELITNFLHSTCDGGVNIGRLLTAELKNQLGANNGDELLIHAQDLACDALRDVWAVFQKHDLDSFISRTSERKNAQQRAFPLYTNPTLNLMTNRTVKATPNDTPRNAATRTLSQVLADARKTSSKENIDGATSSTRVQESGDQTNSVAPYRMMRAVKICLEFPLAGLADADVSDPSDPDEESLDEGSVRRKTMIVLRKSKIKSPPPSERYKAGEEGTRKQTGSQSRAKRSSQGFESPRTTERDQETTKTGVCRAIRKGGKTIHRPSRPRSFMEVLHDQSHFEFFRRYLQVEVGNELPLSFWQSVEQLRMGNVRDPKARQAKAQAVVKKYFNKSTNYGADLNTEADIIADIPNMEKVTPQMLMSAQTCVAKSMEMKWYGEYKESYTDDSSDVASEAPAQVQFGQEGRTIYLWNIFISNVCQFRRGLMTPWLLSLFKDYLGKEVQREVEKQKITGVVSKRIIGGKIVIVDKLQNDLCFWAEVERFKQLADNAARAAAAGTYTIEDEEYVQKKANAIIDVFLDSFVPPRVQINVPQEIADDIIDISQHGIVERGLFHDAAIHTFTVLLYCWKKFTKERLAYKADPSSVVEATILAPAQPKIHEHLAPGEFGPPRVAPPPKKKLKKKKKSSTPTVCGVKVKTIIGASSEDNPRMFYTIEHGVQLILPPKPQPEHESKDRYRNLMQTLINSGHEESLLQLFQQPAALGLGLAQQRRLSRTLAIQFPALLKQNAQ